jgi:hypothetical protein
MAAVIIKKHQQKGPKKINTEEDDDLDVNILPSQDQRVREGQLEKKIITPSGVSWQWRLAVLSANRLSFAKVGDAQMEKICLDYIPLEEIESVELEQVVVATDANQTQVSLLN